MSRRRNDVNDQFEERGLMRLGWAAKELGVEREVIRRYVDAGVLPSESFDLRGRSWRGVKATEVAALKAQMDALRP